MSFVYYKDNKPKVDTKAVFCGALKKKHLGTAYSIRTVLEDLEEAVRKEASEIPASAINNANGAWFEWLLALVGLEIYFSNEKYNIIPIKLPNIREFNSTGLYDDELSALVDDLKTATSSNSNVEFISSNPDFVLIDTSSFTNEIEKMKTFDLEDFSTEDVKELSEYYKLFEGKCGFEDIRGYISMKTSLRPDRRLQMAHEGSLMKALYVHLQTRLWEVNPTGIKYYGVSIGVSEADRRALRTIATHSLVTPNSTPIPAVDEVFDVQQIKDIKKMFRRILIA